MRNLIIFVIALTCICTKNLMGQESPSVVPKPIPKRKDTLGKTDIGDVVKKTFKIKSSKIKPEKGKKLYFSIFPISGTVPGGSGKALITSTTAGMYLGPRKTTYLSTATFAPYFNFKGRFGLPLRTSIWLPNNKWTIQGDIRFLVYPQYTWGLGHTTNNTSRILVNYRYIRFYQSVLRRIKPYLFVGPGYALDYRTNVKSVDSNVRQFTNYQYGTVGNSFSSGLCFQLLYDSRTNSLNPLPGFYTNIIFRINPKILGSNQNWHSLYIDSRKYIALNQRINNQQNTIAFWAYLWTVFDSKTPYLDLPSTGWDPFNRSARGIDQNRYRGKSLLYFESEYRRDITNNGLLGFVVFANINTVSSSRQFFSAWHPAAGTGLRLKFNKGSNTNLCIDFGFSKGFNQVVVGLGEAF